MSGRHSRSEGLSSPRLRALVGRLPNAGAGVPAAEGVLAQIWGREGQAGTGTDPSGAYLGPVPEREAQACDLCAEPIAQHHRHLVDVEKRALKCVCHACSVLFDRRAAGGNHYRLVPERVRRLEKFELPDPLWRGFAVPVDMAFFFHSSVAGRVVAFYPGPMGATESQLRLEPWEDLEVANPVLSRMEPDVEALLVNRVKGAEEYWLVPVDVCYELVALIRTSWNGLAGGPEVWAGLASFFVTLSSRAEPVPAADDAGDVRRTGGRLGTEAQRGRHGQIEGQPERGEGPHEAGEARPPEGRGAGQRRR